MSIAPVSSPKQFTSIFEFRVIESTVWLTFIIWVCSISFPQSSSADQFLSIVYEVSQLLPTNVSENITSTLSSQLSDAVKTWGVGMLLESTVIFVGKLSLKLGSVVSITFIVCVSDTLLLQPSVTVQVLVMVLVFPQEEVSVSE